MRTSVSGSGKPTVPYFGRSGGLMCVGAVVSERPYPSMSLWPVIDSQRRAISFGTGAPPEKQRRSEERSNSCVLGKLTMATFTVAMKVVSVQR